MTEFNVTEGKKLTSKGEVYEEAEKQTEITEQCFQCLDNGEWRIEKRKKF